MPHLTKHYGNTLAVTGQWDYENKPALRDFMDGKSIQHLTQKIARDAIIVLGGDGLMQSAIDTYRDLGLPFLGINFGSRGYLLHPQETVLQAGSFLEKVYPLLLTTVDRDGQKSEHYAFGDVYLKARDPLGVCQYDVNVVMPDGPIQAPNVMGDGIIIATPAGSTGYTRNAGGPILTHGSQSLVMTHISPDRTRGLSPITIPDASIVAIGIKNNSRRPVVVATDGRCIADSEGANSLSITVQKSSQHVTLLVADTHLAHWGTQAFLELGYTS